MNLKRLVFALAAPAVVAAGYLVTAATLKASDPGGAQDVQKLLTEVKTEAVELRQDSEDLDSFTRSKMGWQTYARKIDLVKDHINNAGKLLNKLKAVEETGEAWQQTAIKRIEPLLKELADNTDNTIAYLNANQSKVHLPGFKDYVHANYELSSSLEELIRDFVSYGEAKGRMEELGRKLEITQ